MAEMLKKFTPKAIMGEAMKVPEVQTKLYTIYGIADGVKRGETNYGPWVGLTGRFEAVRNDGLVLASTVAFLPEPIMGMIVASLSQPDAQAVQFGLEVFIKPRPDLPTKYEFIGAPIVEDSENDPLSALRGKVNQALALEAPKEEKVVAGAKQGTKAAK